LGQVGDAISELHAAASYRTEHETRLDDADMALLERFHDPPLPGLERLLQFFEDAPADNPVQGQTDSQTALAEPPLTRMKRSQIVHPGPPWKERSTRPTLHGRGAKKMCVAM